MFLHSITMHYRFKIHFKTFKTRETIAIIWTFQRFYTSSKINYNYLITRTHIQIQAPLKMR